MYRHKGSFARINVIPLAFELDAHAGTWPHRDIHVQLFSRARKEVAPPTAEADAARQSIASASSAGADKHAAASLKEAQTAQAALDAELTRGQIHQVVRPGP